MAQQTPTPEEMTPAAGKNAGADTPRSLRDYIKTTLINTIPPLVAYYALRAYGLTPYLALAGAIVVAVAQGILGMVRKRKVEPTNIAVILGAAASLTIAFTTKNPRIVQVMELIPASLLVFSFLVSGLVGKPSSKNFTGVIAPSLAEGALPQRGWTERDIQDWHKLHTQICVRLGALCGLFPALAVFLIFTLPVDVSLALVNSIGPVLLVLSIVAAVTLIRRFAHRRDQAAAERAGQPAVPSME